MKSGIKTSLSLAIGALLLSSLLAHNSAHSHEPNIKALASQYNNPQVAVSYKLNYQQIIKEYHFRAQYFDIDGWLKSHGVVSFDHKISQHHQAATGSHRQMQAMVIGQAGKRLVTPNVDTPPKPIICDKYSRDPSHPSFNPMCLPTIHDAVDPYMHYINLTTPSSTVSSQAANSQAPINKLENRMGIAGVVATSLCNAYSSINIAMSDKNLVPRFTGPSNYKALLAYGAGGNRNYVLQNGIQFDCIYSGQGHPAVDVKMGQQHRHPRAIGKKQPLKIQN